jgi:hypothetical protein
VNSVEEAYEYSGYYIQRWKIGRFHYVLKSGFAIEKLREQGIDKTTAFILVYSIIAVMILNTTYIGRLKQEPPCSLLLGEDAWKLPYCAANKTRKEPKKPYTIKEAIDYPGWLGCSKRDPSDGPPEVKTIWIGLMKLYILPTYRVGGTHADHTASGPAV